MENLEIAVEYTILINNSTDIGAAPLRKDCHKFASLHKLDQFKIKLI